MTTTRYACCYIPQFPIALWLQQEPPLALLPLAVAATDSESSPLVVYNDHAEQAGVTNDMTVAQAHAACPDLHIKVREEQREKASSRAIVKTLQTLSPFVEEITAGLYFLNASGMRFVYDNDPAFARQIISTLQTAGLPIQVGLAASKFVAQIAAETAPDNNFAVVPTGHEKQFLANVSIDYLPVSSETKQSLFELGLRTIGLLAAFPTNELMERFATDGSLLSRLANGHDPSFFVPELPPEMLSKTVSLTFSLFNTQTLLLYVEHLLESLLEGLRHAGRCCTICLIECRLEDKTTLSLNATLDQPSVVIIPFLRQLRKLAEPIELTAGVSDITVIIPESSVLILEQLAFQQRAIGAATSDRSTPMAKLAKQAHLLRPELYQSHLPEQNFKFIPATMKKAMAVKSSVGTKPHGEAQTNRERKTTKRIDMAREAGATIELELSSAAFSATAAASSAASPIISTALSVDSSPEPLSHPYTGQKLTGFRLLQPPVAGDVVSNGKEPLLFRFKKKMHHIERKFGPWKLSGNWWSEMFDRLYYEIQTTDRKLYLVYYDRVTARWFVQGVFD